MKYLIVFKSRHGTTRKMVEHMQEALGKNQTQVVELGKDTVPDLTTAETILIGGSIHAGLIQNEVKKFCEENKEVLMKKRLGLFLCYMLKQKEKEEFENAFSVQLRNHAIAIGRLGGELLLEKMNWFERFMTKVVGRTSTSVSKIDYQALTEFERKVKTV